jgi:HJR/Mrr/RecB family endonuclease
MDPALLAAAAAASTLILPLAIKTVRATLRRRRLRTIEGLADLHPTLFEKTVAGWLARAGWLVEHRGKTGDGGIDIVAFRDGRVLAVQCKRYQPSRAVAAAHLRDLYGAATALGATSAYLVTTGRVSKPASLWVADLPPTEPELLIVRGDDLARIASSRRWDPPPGAGLQKGA